MRSLVGIGYDTHRLATGRRLILGGVEISHERGLQGHSDADVLTHAVIDALLGAAGLGDIGEHFPDTDERWRDADSIELLQTVVATVLDAGYEIVNVDCTVLMEAPRLAPHKQAIRTRLAATLGLPVSARERQGHHRRDDRLRRARRGRRGARYRRPRPHRLSGLAAGYEERGRIGLRRRGDGGR